MEVPIHLSERTISSYRQVQALLDQLDPEAAPKALIVPGSPLPQGKIIVFPGSFNPPTNAHLALLEAAQKYVRQHAPMEVYAAVSKHTINKEAVERPLLLDRILLLKTVLQRHLPQTGIMFFNRGLYVEEAEAVHTSFPKVTKLLFLIGFDKIVQILDPRYYKDRDAALHELFALADLLVAPRGDAGADALTTLLSKLENQPFAGHIHALPFDTSYRNISSSQIRSNTSMHLQDVPQEVGQFIRETHAYELPLRQVGDSKMDYYGERVKALEALLKKNASDEK